jgi:hypothetical protein
MNKGNIEEYILKMCSANNVYEENPGMRMGDEIRLQSYLCYSQK